MRQGVLRGFLLEGGESVMEDCKNHDFNIFSSLSFLLFFLWMMVCFPVFATTDGDWTGRRIEAVVVILDGGDQENPTYRNAVLKAFSTYPGDHFDPIRSNMMLNQVRRLNFAKSASYLPQMGSNGDVEILVRVELGDKVKPLHEGAIGILAGGPLSDFPTLYADDKDVLQAKLENKTMVFANSNAFFGRPEVLTAGNPLAVSPSGASPGVDSWLESSVEAGVYGLSRLTERVSVFAGLSSIASGSWGQELFTDEARSYVHVEDAYIGFIGNSTTGQGGIRQVNFLVGRKAFQVDNGMILRLASANGGDRAALQSNPRNAADQLLFLQFVHDQHRLELFRFDPDELDEIDSKTVIEGLNYDGRLWPDFRLGGMFLQVSESDFSYYSPSAVMSRKGLHVTDIRAAYEPPSASSDLYIKAELARQTHEDFAMDARAGYAEIGYQLNGLSGQPVLSYRYSRFTGDDAATASFERWDPLFAGGAGDEWVQGLNQYKVVQTSNVIAHRFMARLRSSPQLELTPQFWVFRADEYNNLGGAQALSVLSSKDLGREVNVTARYISDARLIFVFSAAYTQPGSAIRDALNGDYNDWLSASALVVARF